MRKLFTKSSLCIAAGCTASGIFDRAETLQVGSGHVWITVEGAPDDHWLKAGESLTVPAGRLIVIEAHKLDSRIDLPGKREARRSFDFFAPLRAVVQQPEQPAGCQ
jgi:hypothetical protein